MDQLGGFSMAGGGGNDNNTELELETLGLAMFNVDADLAECFENCPEWNDPLLDPVLEELRDCLSEDLWCQPDLQLLTEGDGGTHLTNNQIGAPSPLSPDSALSPTLSVASSTISSTSSFSSDAPSPQKVPSPWGGAGGVGAGGVGAVWNLPPQPSATPTVQVLKSGEMIQMKVNTLPPPQQHQPAPTAPVVNPATAIPASISSPPPSVVIPQTLLSPTTPSQPPSTATTPLASPTASRKRRHPDSPSPGDNGTAGGGEGGAGGVDMSQLSKKQQRLIKNREAASASRQKKKEYVQTLETRLREAAQKNTTLLGENESLRKQVLQLQAENKVLRLSLTQSSNNSFLTLQKPALVMVVCLCFVSLLFLPKFSSLSLFSGPTSTALSVTRVAHIPGRALLEYRDVSDPSSSASDSDLFSKSTTSPLDRSSNKQSSSERALISDRRSSTTSTSALVPVSSQVTDRSYLEALEAKFQELQRLYATTRCPPPPVPSSSVCSCPPSQNDHSSNTTALRLLSEEMTECFKWYEKRYPRWLHPTRDTPSDNSLAVVVNSNTASLLSNSEHYQVTELQEMPLLYKSFKKYFTRKLDTFYLISFKDHLLLNAPLHNSTENPVLSVIIPTEGFSQDTFPMLQMDCEVVNTNIIHFPRVSL